MHNVGNAVQRQIGVPEVGRTRPSGPGRTIEGAPPRRSDSLDGRATISALAGDVEPGLDGPSGRLLETEYLEPLGATSSDTE